MFGKNGDERFGQADCFSNPSVGDLLWLVGVRSLDARKPHLGRYPQRAYRRVIHLSSDREDFKACMTRSFEGTSSPCDMRVPSMTITGG